MNLKIRDGYKLWKAQPDLLSANTGRLLRLHTSVLMMAEQGRLKKEDGTDSPSRMFLTANLTHGAKE